MENKIIAGCLVVLTSLMIGVFFMTLSLKNKKCDCPGTMIPINVTQQQLNKALNENLKAIDSVGVHSDTTVDGSLWELLQRYKYRHPDQRAERILPIHQP